MIDEPHLRINEQEWDRGLWWMVLASGAAHVVAFVLLLLIPQSFAHHPPPLVSYTVDLVAPDKIGGTNVIAGGKGRVEGAPMNAAPPAPKVEAPPAPPKVEAAKPPPPPEKPAPKEIAKAEAPKVEPKPPVKEPPKVEPKPKGDEAVLAEKVKKAAPPATTAAKPAPSPVKAAPSPKVVAKAEPAKAAPPAKVDTAAAKKQAAEEAAARQRDERILAAVKRAEQQVGTRGGGIGQKPAEQPGGPISVGPGQGAGGKVMGLEYVLYYNALDSRLKQNWAWAGSTSLEAVVHFSITDTGDVVDVRITRSSGDPSYDASVERAVKAVNPLPPPPEQYRQEFANVEWTFNAESRQQ